MQNLKTTNLLEYINSKTENHFKYLKLKQVVFDTARNVCLVNMIYPNDEILEENDKEKIKTFVQEYIDMDCKLEVKINKSFVEEDLVKKAVFFYLEKNSPAFFNSFEKSGLKVTIEGDKVNVEFHLDERLNNYYLKYNIDKGLLKFLDKNFCANFEVRSQSVDSITTPEDFLKTRLDKLKAESDLKALLGHAENKYAVTDKKVIVGKEITFNPRYISSLKKTQENCVVAGKINFLSERSYKSKKIPKDKDKEPETKPYFSFILKDDSGTINAVIFPSKKHYHKMHLLKNGDSVVVSGNASVFNERLEIMIKDVSLCQIPSKSEINFVNNTRAVYRFVKPLKYHSSKQTNLFDQKPKMLTGMKDCVVYDFETTGLDSSKDEIIEIGALKIKNGTFSEVFTTLVRPKNPIPPLATKINHITNEMVSNAFFIEQVIGDFYLFCKDCDMVGYNSIAFDSQFLFKAGKAVNLEFDNHQIDVMNMAREKLKNLRNYKLVTVSKFLDINLVDAHRALNDVIATAEAFLKLY